MRTRARTELFSRRWWRSARNRAARSAAQAFLLATGSAGIGWKQLNVLDVGIIVAAFFTASIATSIAFNPVPEEEAQ
jgi:hypothetical protein